VRRKTVGILVAKLLLSAALLALVLAKVDLDSVLRTLATADVAVVLAWYSLVPISISLSAWRWRMLAPGLTLGTALKYTWIGVFFGHVLPGSIAGDIAKGVSLALKDSSARAGLAASIIAEKMIGLLALLLFFDLACAVIYLLYGEASLQVRHLAALALMLSMAGAVGLAVAIPLAAQSRLFLEPRQDTAMGRLIAGVGSAARFYSNKPGILGKAFLVSMAIHMVNILGTYLSFVALHLEGGMLLASVVYPILSVMLLIPISISGIGVRDATLALLFALFGLSAASGVALSWLTLLAVIPNVAIGGSIQLIEMYRKH
jgi:uncharacterized protein (TIRG00374 family)